MGEMAESAKNSEAGLKMDGIFRMKGISADCRKKKARFSFVSDKPSESFQDIMLNIFFCPEAARNYPEINPYQQAINAGWSLGASVTFSDGTKKEMKLCQ
jgi:hypothetical protein